ncbi:MAG: penicillin-binding transpeptidase domain-containing protein, partial [Phycisphaeraceae bacterium]|nr:penicillin-binding transpeptidase domain-containing protein [Phycisphaeraceae bacterium]
CQQAAAEAVDRHTRSLPEGADVAVVVLEIDSGAVRALIGSADPADRRDGQVNGATARRSPGSTLKPFVYATAYEANRLCGDSRLMDEPITLGGWSPQNFDRRYRGQVTADEALRQSLNVPAITVARQIGLERCAALMRAAGVDLAPDAEHRGGLATVVGGSEVTLLHLTNAYATLGRGGFFQPVRLFENQRFKSKPVLSERTCAALNEALGSHHRTPHGLSIAPSWFMWKTGTSSRRRDAWAVGHNGRWAIGVWAGHFNGASRGQYIGRLAAEPLLAALFSCKRFASDRSAPKPVRWAVHSPLKANTPSDLTITHPTEGATYRSLGGPFELHPKVSGNRGEVLWFLNGRPIRPGRQTVRPGVGRHQLICRDAKARLDSVQFVIR